MIKDNLKNFFSIFRNYFKKTDIEKSSYLSLLILVLLLPVFAIPSSLIPIHLGKNLFIFFAVALSLTFYIISIIRKGEFNLPKNLIFISSGILILFYFLSSVISPASRVSFWGYGFEIDTFSFILVMFLMLFLVSEIFRTKKRVLLSYLAFFISLLIVAFLQILRLIIGQGFLSFGQFSSKLSSFVGSPNDLAIFFGIGVILSAITIETLSLSKNLKYLMSLVIALSLVFIAIINFMTVWVVLGIFSILFFLYMFSFSAFLNKGQDSEKSKPAYLTSLVILIISLVFILSGNHLGNYISSSINAVNLEIRPSIQSSFEVAKGTFLDYKILGSGPNRFFNQWVEFKPAAFNEFWFWNTDFSYGSSVISTFLTTLGPIGFLLWLAFIFLILYFGFKAIIHKSKDAFSRYISISSFALTFYLWVMAIFYVPSSTIFALTFFFTGIFLASLYHEGIISSKSVLFLKEPKTGFIAVAVLMAILIANVFFVYSVSIKTLSAYYFNKSASSFAGESSVDEVEKSLNKAVSLNQNDVYYRALSDLYLFKLSNMLTSLSASGQSIDEASLNELQELIYLAENSAQGAISYDDTNYQNWVFLGRVYETMSLAGIEEAYELSKNSYNKALELNPKNPLMHMRLANLDVINKNFDGAKEGVAKAIRLKSNYIDGYLFLSQIEVTEGNIKEAISSVSRAALISPGDAGVNFQLGFLKYHDGDFEGAISSMERAVKIAPNYSNARYFLGLSYEKVGRREDALVQFEEVKKLNAENQEIDEIIKNIKSGNSPFSDTDQLVNTNLFDGDSSDVFSE